jgi:hypothetical protein
VKLTTHLHLVPRSKNDWSYTSTPQYAFMVWCLVKQGQLYLTFTFNINVEFCCVWNKILAMSKENITENTTEKITHSEFETDVK